MPTAFNSSVLYDDAIRELHVFVKDHEDVKALPDQYKNMEASCRGLMKATRQNLGLARETKLICPSKEKLMRSGFNSCVPLRTESETRRPSLSSIGREYIWHRAAIVHVLL